MKISTATALMNLYKEFCSVRIKYLGSRSIRSLRYFFKTISFQKAYLDILELEHGYQKKTSLWIKQYIDKNGMTVQQIRNASTTFQLFREELTGKNLFLIVFMVLLGLTGSFYDFLKDDLGPTSYSAIIAANWLFAFLAILERGRVVWHITSSNQLQILLDKWIVENT